MKHDDRHFDLPKMKMSFCAFPFPPLQQIKKNRFLTYQTPLPHRCMYVCVYVYFQCSKPSPSSICTFINNLRQLIP